MKKQVFFSAVAFLPLLVTVSAAAEPGLRVSDNGRYLTRPDGSPFFYLGDTAWELFHRLDRDEADRYLKDRAAKGFTVIQAVALAEEDGLNTPNSHGHRPLIDNDPTRPDVKPGKLNDYWDHVDYIVDKAQSFGMFIGMLPTWGDKWNLKWGVGPEVFTPENAEIYGKWLGSRYRDRSIIWILGGDRPIESDRHRQIINAMARGLKRGDGGAHLMTYHPCGGTNSADLFHEADWLDFNMTQSGHRRPCRPNYEFIKKVAPIVPPGIAFRLIRSISILFRVTIWRSSMMIGRSNVSSGHFAAQVSPRPRNQYVNEGIRWTSSARASCRRIRGLLAPKCTCRSAEYHPLSDISTQRSIRIVFSEVSSGGISISASTGENSLPFSTCTTACPAGTIIVKLPSQLKLRSLA